MENYSVSMRSRGSPRSVAQRRRWATRSSDTEPGQRPARFFSRVLRRPRVTWRAPDWRRRRRRRSYPPAAHERSRWCRAGGRAVGPTPAVLPFKVTVESFGRRCGATRNNKPVDAGRGGGGGRSAGTTNADRTGGEGGRGGREKRKRDRRESRSSPARLLPPTVWHWVSIIVVSSARTPDSTFPRSVRDRTTRSVSLSIQT